jgi:hypothetical protein
MLDQCQRHRRNARDDDADVRDIAREKDQYGPQQGKIDPHHEQKDRRQEQYQGDLQAVTCIGPELAPELLAAQLPPHAVHTPTKLLVRRAGYRLGTGEPEESLGVQYEEGSPQSRNCHLYQHRIHDCHSVSTQHGQAASIYLDLQPFCPPSLAYALARCVSSTVGADVHCAKGQATGRQPGHVYPYHPIELGFDGWCAMLKRDG